MATVCSFFKTPFKRALAWTLAYAGFRLLGSLAAPVPFMVPLDPLAICLAALLAEERHGPQPALRCILLAAMVAGDLAAGLSAASWALRLAGALLLLSARPAKVDSLTQALRFAAAHAVWSALAPEFRGEYPFPYTYSVTLIQSLLFIGLLVPLLPNDAFRPGSSFLQIMGMPAAVLALWMLFAPSPLWPPPALGNFAGPWTRAGALLLLLPPLLPNLRPLRPLLRKRAPSSEDPSPSRWRDLVE